MKKYLILSASILYLIMLSCKKEETKPINFNDNLDYGSFTDSRDNRIYKTIKVGNQVWMAENLAYQPNGSNSIDCIYGRLYTYDINETLCPEGWHIPDENEWNELIEYLGGENKAGGKMKESGTGHWKEPNSGANNSSGFSALPAGYYNIEEGYGGRYTSAFFWAKKNEEYFSQIIHLNNHGTNVNILKEYNPDSFNYGNSFSIRCIKN